MSITPIEPLTVPHIGPTDDDWYDDDDTSDTPEHIAQAIEAHCRTWLSRYANNTKEMQVITQLVKDTHAICAGIARSHKRK